MMTADEPPTLTHPSPLEAPSGGTPTTRTTTTDIKTSMAMQVDDEEEDVQGERKATERPRPESVVERRTTSVRARLVVDREKVNFYFLTIRPVRCS